MSKANDLDKHRARAIGGIFGGLSVLCLAAFKCYQTWHPNLGSQWAWFILPAVFLLAWGSSHLAQHRGYPSAAAYGLVIVSLVVSAGIGYTQTPLTIGAAVLFIGILPVTLLLALPKRFGALRRK